MDSTPHMECLSVSKCVVGSAALVTVCAIEAVDRGDGVRIVGTLGVRWIRFEVGRDLKEHIWPRSHCFTYALGEFFHLSAQIKKKGIALPPTK